MAEKDLTEKILEDYPDVFADIFNALVFHGEQIIKADELSESIVHSQYKADDSKVHELERDVAKRWIRNNINLAICGIENQSQSERLMIPKVLGYDGASYRIQVLNIDSEKRNLRKLHKEQKITDAEYTERLKSVKEQIAPVVTIVLYFGTDRHWTAPTSLKELLDIPGSLEPFVNDYKIHVFEVAWLSDEQIACMTSDFKIVAQYFKELRLGTHNVMDRDADKLRHMDEVLKLLSALTRDSTFIDVMHSENYKEMISMSDVMNWAKKEGRMEGRIEGQDELAMLWKWLQDLGRSDEAVEMMSPSNKDLRKTLFAEYEIAIQKK